MLASLPTLTVLYKKVVSYPVLSCPVLSCPVLSCPVLSCPVLSCPVLSCPFLSFPFLSFPFLSFPFLFSPLLSSPLLSSPNILPSCLSSLSLSIPEFFLNKFISCLLVPVQEQQVLMKEDISYRRERCSLSM